MRNEKTCKTLSIKVGIHSKRRVQSDDLWFPRVCENNKSLLITNSFLFGEQIISQSKQICSFSMFYNSWKIFLLAIFQQLRWKTNNQCFETLSFSIYFWNVFVRNYSKVPKSISSFLLSGGFQEIHVCFFVIFYWFFILQLFFCTTFNRLDFRSGLSASMDFSERFSNKESLKVSELLVEFTIGSSCCD